MKIKWTDGKKEIPKVGEVNTGDILEVSTELGNAFVKQGQARKVTKGSYVGNGKASQKIKISKKGGDR